MKEIPILVVIVGKDKGGERMENTNESQRCGEFP